MTVDYSQVERRLDSFVNYEVLPGFGFAEAGYDLDHVRELLRRLGRPHLRTTTVHVAGSKGKGSVSALIANALSACGHRTGLYTSPHLLHLGERIRVDGTFLTPYELGRMLDLAGPHIEAMRIENRWRQFTYFEVITALAFLYFRSRAVAVQVIEVGLGGRLDATNVVQPDVCVITPISLEHTAVLGDTIEKIAAEKAGIIKAGAAVVCGPQDSRAMRVIESACAANGLRPVIVGKDVTFEVLQGSLDGQSILVRDARGEREYLTRLTGTFQAENTATAVAAIEVLGTRGVKLDFDCVAQGLATTAWPGRFHILSRDPLLILDGAHNPASMRRLAESLAAFGATHSLVFVLGFSSDKDVRGAVRELLHLGGSIILTQSGQPRALRTSAAVEMINDLGVVLASEEDTLAALQHARTKAGKKGTVCVGGSLYLVAEVLRWWQDKPAAQTNWATGRDIT